MLHNYPRLTPEAAANMKKEGMKIIGDMLANVGEENHDSSSIAVFETINAFQFHSLLKVLEEYKLIQIQILER